MDWIAITAWIGALAAVSANPALGAEPAARRSHPYLFFGAEEVEAYKSVCATALRPQFDEIASYAEGHLGDEPPALKGDYEERGLAVEHPYLTNILDFSFLYLLTGEERYLKAAKRWTLALASMEEWGGRVVPDNGEPDRGLYAGFGLTALACAYDWLHGEFTEDELALVRGRIEKTAEGIFRATYGGEWWSGAYLHHDHWIPVAGMGLGAIAVMDETPRAAEWARRAEAEFFQAFNRLGDDGAWHEGVCGWAFGMASMCPFWDAYGRRFGTRLDESEWLRNTWKFRLYSRTPEGAFVTFGDGRTSGAYQWTAWQAAPTLRFLAAKFRNPYAQWLAAREWQARPNPYTAVWEIIWSDTELDEASPARVTGSVLFENEGIAILRSGAGEDEAIAAFHCDSVVGANGARYYEGGDSAINTGADHAHADGNSFILWARGAAVSPAGYGQRETEFQNSLLVGGKGQYRFFDRVKHPGRPKGGIKRFFSGRFASFVTGEAAECYEGGLKKFERTLFLSEPGIAFVVDEVAAERRVSLEWLFHLDKRATAAAMPDGFTAESAGGTTLARFERGAVFEGTMREDRLNRRIAAATEAREVRLAGVIVPNVPAGKTAVVDTPEAGVFVAEALGSKLAAVFPEGAGRFEALGRITGEGACAVIALEGSVSGFLAVDAKELRLDGEALLSSPVPVTVSCRSDGKTGSLTISSPERTQVAVNPRMATGSVTRGVGRLVPFLTDGPGIILNVKAGTESYELAGGAAAAEGN